MPYVSDRQRRWAHTADAKAKGFPTKEFDAEEHEAKLRRRKRNIRKALLGRGKS